MYNEVCDGSLPAEEGVPGQHPCQQAVNGCRHFQRVLDWLGTPLLCLHYQGAGLRLGMGKSDGNRKEWRKNKRERVLANRYVAEKERRVLVENRS